MSDTSLQAYQIIKRRKELRCCWMSKISAVLHRGDVRPHPVSSSLVITRTISFLETGSSAGVGKSGSDGELVDVDGSDGQVVTLGLESSFISNPCQSDLLAFWGDVVGRSLVGVASAGFVRVLAVRVLAVAGLSGQLLLGLRLFSGGSVRSSVAK